MVFGQTPGSVRRHGHRRDRKQEKASVNWAVETFIG